MKRVNIINLVSFAVCIIIFWNFSYVMYKITPFLVIPLLFIMFLIGVNDFVYTIIICVKNFKIVRKKALIPLGIYVTLLVITIFFPYGSKIYVDHFLFENKRLEIVQSYINGEEISVPAYLSITGEIKAQTFENGDIAVGFWEYVGMMSSFSLVYYVSSEDVIEKISFGDYQPTRVKKLSDNFYLISFD